MGYKVLFSNIGYARGIDGTLKQHLMRIGTHIYCRVPLQQQVLDQLKNIVAAEQPDLCCFIEIDEGSFHSAYFNQLRYLLDGDYNFSDIADKYGPGNWLRNMPLHIGKSSAFMAKAPLPFERLYFSTGTKRLIHRVELPDGTPLFFTHFSLRRDVRRRQFSEMKDLLRRDGRPAVVLADFNIMQGFSELEPLLNGTDLKVMGDENNPTFTFHRVMKTLDLCICSAPLAGRITLKIIPQPFSDHAALLVEIS